MYGIILIGPPCSGKSTIGKEYARTYDIDYISSGDIARMMATESAAAKAELDRGNMAPEDEMRKRIWEIIGYQWENKIPFILDGFPRFVEQDEWLRKQFAHTINWIYVVIELDEDTCEQRANNRGRPDDKYIYSRIRYYNEQTRPITDRYNDVIYIPGINPTPDDLYRRIEEHANGSKV